ncbi:MAG: hypothetical protein A3J99_05710 [Sideroxydans sp. RIFOXYD2_FULL_59_7]|nr:MAG: hypothetical protein A3J99_05710 [Sideroxydans sp. RIFOXYD2_FULL_59_7]
MSQRVIDFLESVQIEKHCGYFVFVAFSQGDGTFQVIQKQGAVGKIGQVIIVGQMRYFLFGQFAFSNITHDAGEVT